jgi:hypothetical protein
VARECRKVHPAIEEIHKGMDKGFASGGARENVDASRRGRCARVPRLTVAATAGDTRGTVGAGERR